MHTANALQNTFDACEKHGNGNHPYCLICENDHLREKFEIASKELTELRELERQLIRMGAPEATGTEVESSA